MLLRRNSDRRRLPGRKSHFETAAIALTTALHLPRVNEYSAFLQPRKNRGISRVETAKCFGSISLAWRVR
jgi:hypothetical protein